MIDVEMTRDIREYEPKLFNLITTRQVIILVIGLAIAVPVAIWLPVDDIAIRMIIATIFLAPFIACGWVNVYGMRLEQFVMQMIKSSLLLPKNRKYKPEGTIDFLPAPTKTVRGTKKKIIRSKNYTGRK